MKTSSSVKESWRPYAIAFAITVAAITISSYLPDLRLWGLGAWAHTGDWTPTVAGLAALSAFTLILSLRNSREPAGSPAGYYVALVAITVAGGAVFAAFRTETHFLGDGYALLGLLSAEHPLVKGREIGESMAHVWVKQLVGKTGGEGALWSFRIISVASGVLFTASVIGFARKLFDDWAHRWVFVGGLLTGGYMLLFFGYVENYSLYALSVGIFVLTGLAVARGVISRWWILAAVAVPPVMHVLGLTLIPGAVYLLVADTRVGRRLGRVPRALWWVVGAAGVMFGLVALDGIGGSTSFVRFSLLRVVADRFTVDGYTLFSAAHLLDTGNLLLVLTPSLGVAATVVWLHRRKGLWHDRGIQFLAVTALAALGGIFLFDPKLGMPRDWDLFAYTGIPLTALVFRLITGLPTERRHMVQIGAAAIVLGLLSLSGRVAVQNMPASAVAQFKHYLQLDFRRGVNARVALVDYYLNHGDTVTADLMMAEWYRDFPEAKLVQDAKAVKLAGDRKRAMAMFYQVLELNPHSAGAWGSLGEIYVGMDMLDTAQACLETAVGLNPYEMASRCNLGVVAVKRGDYARALEHFEDAYHLDSGDPVLLFNLALTCMMLGDKAEGERYLTECAVRPNAPVAAYQRLADLYLERGDYRAAADVLRRGTAAGLPDAVVSDRVKQFPRLGQELKR